MTAHRCIDLHSYRREHAAQPPSEQRYKEKKTFNSSPSPTGVALPHRNSTTQPSGQRRPPQPPLQPLKPLLHPIMENSALQDLHFRFREQSLSAASKYAVSSIETKAYESTLSNEEDATTKKEKTSI
jgi:hypothetical protein